MLIKLFTLVTLWTYGVLAYEYHCSTRSALLLLKRPAYEFSVKMLQRVSHETDNHFVYSPMSTWLQLSALAEGATGTTFKEIWRVTKHHRNKCFKKQLSGILRKLNKDLSYEIRKKSVIAIDKLMAVKKNYVRDIQKFYGISVMLLEFNEPMKSANVVNEVIEDGTGGVVDQIVYYDDFISTVLIMSDANYFRSEWKIPFNGGTVVQPFYSHKGLKIGEVSMMNQIGNYHIADIPHIGATVLEIPCASDRIKMLVFLPKEKLWVSEIFYNLQGTRLTAIFNMYKHEHEKLVNVTMPKFRQRTEIENLPELIYDMGIKRIFKPKVAEFKGISKFDVYASLMAQTTEIDVNEKGVTGYAGPLLKKDNVTDFLVNRPFAYMIVDKVTDFILFAGMYSVPSVV